MIVDLYAGAGGWDEGAHQLGLTTVGLEIWHDACVTATKAGHPRIRCDVATYPTRQFVGLVRGLIASPPCTTFSSAGAGGGRQVIEILLRALDELAAGKATRAARRKECQRVIAAWAVTKRPKMRRAERAAWAWDQAGSAVQVLEPLRFARDLRPDWIALEQVEAVLPIWRHIAHILRSWGYNSWVGVLNSADYGVPQTRKRAVLIASCVRRVGKPEATHEQNPPEDVLFGARLPWVSMAQALGWVGVDRPARTVCGNRAPRWAYEQGNSTATGWTLVNGPQGNAAVRSLDEPAGTIYCSRPGNLRWTLHTNHGQEADGSRQTIDGGRPAPSVTGKSGGQWVFTRPSTTVQGDPRIGRPGHKDRASGEQQFEQDSLRVTVAEASILQSFPADYPWHGNKTSRFLQVGNAVPPRLAAAVIAQAAGRAS